MESLWLGCYTQDDGVMPGARGEGIYTASYPNPTGHWAPAAIAATVENPSFLLFSPKHSCVFAVTEGSESLLHVFRPAPGHRPENLATLALHGSGACHLCLSGDEDLLFISNYNSGSICLVDVASPVAPRLLAEYKLTGRGPDPVRQEAPHAHSCCVQANESVLVADLGTDRIWRYTVTDGQLVELAEQPFIQLPAKSGPRHMALHANGRWMYVSLELSGQVAALEMDAEGRWQLRQTLDLALPSYQGLQLPSDIHLSADGAVLYTANRGPDELVWFRVDGGTGLLELAGRCGCGGRFPRHMLLDSTARRLLVANQISGNVAAFALDGQGNILQPAFAAISVPAAACVAAIQNPSQKQEKP